MTRKKSPLNPAPKLALVATGGAVPDGVRGALESALASAKSENTRAAYRSAWAAWTAWAQRQGVCPLPALPEAVAGYLAARVDAGAGLATLRMACASIGEAHRLADLHNPATSPLVKTALAGFARQAAQAGIATKQAPALTSEAVATIRGHLNGPAGSEAKALQAVRDMALVSLAACSGLRRSELAALDWADIASEPDGSGRVTVRRSKTDQEGAGAVVAATPAAMADLAAWADVQSAGRTGPVFGIGAVQIRNRIRAVAKAAGLGDGFTGHSGRVGMAVTMTRNGAPAAATMRQGRWQSARMVARYTRKISAGEALKYL